MGAVLACIAPHTAEAIPELAGNNFDAFAETCRSVEELKSFMHKQKLQTIIAATSHNLRLEATMRVVRARCPIRTIMPHSEIEPLNHWN